MNARQLLRTASVAGASIVLAAVPLTSASAAAATQVNGLLSPDSGHVCTDHPDALAAQTVDGSLVGCWYVDTADYKSTNQGGGFLATGTETFIGCLGDRCGSFRTTFTFTAKYRGDVEQHGRCHHPVVGGDGGFAGVTGEISMHDEPNGCAPYHGALKLG